MLKVTYHANNSGGGWWLDDDDWKALEEAGWTVDWRRGRWLGALATSATREGLTLGEAIAEWEAVTGENSADLGCSCCGTPHSFETDDGDYYSPDFPAVGTRYEEQS